MRTFKSLIIILAISFFNSCTNNDTILDAVPYKIDDLNKLPGYGWFYEEYDKFQVDTNLIKQIEQVYNPAVHKIIIYSMPSCACPGLKYTRFPQFYKILQFAGINTSNIELYSLSSIRSRHPYDSMIVLSTLPSFYVFKQSKVVYSIIDTLDYNIYYGKPYPIKLEELLYEGLKK